jgi:hypothetical protein
MTADRIVIRTATSTWQIDANGYLLTASGAKIARVSDGAIMLFDKRTHREVPLTLDDFYTITQTELGAG